MQFQQFRLADAGNLIEPHVPSCGKRALRWLGDTSQYPWASAVNDFVKSNLTWQGSVEQHPLVNYLEHEGGSLSNPTPEHFLPLLYVLGAWNGAEPISVPVDGIEMGSLSMLSVRVG